MSILIALAISTNDRAEAFEWHTKAFDPKVLIGPASLGGICKPRIVVILLQELRSLMATGLGAREKTLSLTRLLTNRSLMLLVAVQWT
ncbi:hypothetical protein ABIF97_004048 [Bradyrhizobium japonicum]